MTGDIAIDNAGATSIASGVIVNADVNASAAIAYSKLNLGTSIVNADVNASAAIAGSKIVSAASGVAGVVSTGTQTFTGVKTFETSGTVFTGSGITTVSINGVGGNADLFFTNSGTQKWVMYNATGSSDDFNIADAGSTTRVHLAQNNSQWFNGSDERHKHDLVDITGGLAKVKKIRPVIFSFDTDPKSKERQAGVLAQNVDKVFPEAVSKSNPDYWSVAYTSLIPLTISAIQEEDKKVVALEAKVAALDAKFAELDAKFEQYKKAHH